jgi:hypothetical protein
VAVMKEGLKGWIAEGHAVEPVPGAAADLRPGAEGKESG